MVAKILVINEYRIAASNEIWLCVIGFVTPKNIKAMKQRRNPLIKNAKEPSKVLVVFTHGRFIFIFPYFLPITDARVSEIIINRIPAIGKYIWYGAIIAKSVINIVIDKQ